MSEPSAAGADALYRHTPEGEKAAEQEVAIPGSSDQAPSGENQAEDTEENDLPA